MRFSVNYWCVTRADLYGNESVEDLLKFKPSWSSHVHSQDNVLEFTEDEQRRLRLLPNKNYILGS